ncbi:MAG: AAA family ATPase [Candidatus Lokiarchaeota archaeon]|nr:AAA family ATPase [Candidatus Lokiarchaeota archaeon]
MKSDIRVVAVTGKGGTGKTIFTYLFAQNMIDLGYYPLLIDADPTMSHLTHLLNQKSNRSMESVRKQIIQVALRGKEDENQKLAEKIDIIIEQSIMDTDKYSLLVMGQPDSKGCFCATNSLLRNVISTVIQDYDLILIDAEAGLEQIHRQVLGEVDYIIIITDYSLRSVETAEFIAKSANNFIGFKKIGLIVNKKMGDFDAKFKDKIEQVGIPIIGVVPFDEKLIKIEQMGESLDILDDSSVAVKAIKRIAQNLLETN